MAFAFSTSTKEVLEQVIREPRFRALTTIPVFAPVSVGLIVLAYLLFAVSSYFYLEGSLHWSVMMLLNGIAIYGAFTPLHDATHRTLSGNRFINDLFGTIACFALLPGITTRIYRYLHLEHHRFSGDKHKDPDEPFVSAPPWLLPFVLAAPDVLWTIWYLRHWSERPWSERLEFAAGIAFYVGWHVVWLLSPYALAFFLLWMIPQRIGVTIVTYFFAHIQHPEDVLWEEAPFQATVYVRANWFQRWIMLGQTEHCLHHLLPSVPFYRYHRAWESGKALFESQNVPVRNFFSGPEQPVLPQDRAANWITARVTAVEKVADGIQSYELRPIDGSVFPAFDAGAHIDVRIADGVVRQYSMYNSPSEQDRYLIAVKREDPGRGGSRQLQDETAVGDTLQISAPRNNFPLRAQIDRTILIAGGIGITPILSMAHKLHERGDDFEMHICVRNNAMLPFGSSLRELPFADRLIIHTDDGEAAQKFDPATHLGSGAPSKHLYICGPSAFMAWVIGAAKDQGWADDAIYSETFVPRVIETRENKPFEVVLGRSGKVLKVKADEFLIDVLNRHKCGIPCSCTQGICGSCITPVLEGEPDHRDAIMTDEERSRNDKMCVCVGRARGDRLVLDV